MRRLLALVTMMGMTAVSVHAQGIAARNADETLRGLAGVHVVVESLPSAAAEAGFTSSDIKTAIEARLLQRDIHVLGLGALAMDPRGPTLLAKVDLAYAEPVYIYAAQLQFFQNVEIDIGDQSIQAQASASTWQVDEFGTMGRFRVGTLPQEVAQLADRFIDAYLKMNEAEVEQEEVEEEMEGEEQMDEQMEETEAEVQPGGS